MQKINNGKNIVLGTCYYPEHWSSSLWEEDLERMLQVGIKVVRVAEFAWNKFEPREGEYDFSFFDGFLDLAHKKGMQVIFCTPTATPPAWLSKKYPEILNVDINGVRIEHGARRQYNYNSPVFREFSQKITRVMAEHYGQHPAIIGWQLDNEFNCECKEFYSESDTKAFRKFLQEKYVSLDVLNEAWGTVFWNQTYTDWEEVDVPKRTNNYAMNPHRALDYLRFVSDSVCTFAQEQADIIRQYKKEDDFITTNGMFENIDYHRMTRESLDYIMYDSYPNFAFCLDDYQEEDFLKDRKWSRNLMEIRAISPIFGIMEQQSGANGWNDRMEAPSPKPGQLTLWTMQSIAHGADYISYFRWRTCTVGTEIYWHGILDYSGRENRRLREVKSVYEKLDRLQEVAGAVYDAKVAVIKDYDNIWDSQVDKWHQRVEKTSQKALFEELERTHTPFDYVYFTENMTWEQLAKYEVVFYPHASILTRSRMEILESYVENGGKLVMGCRTGYKNIHGHCVMDHLPGLAAKVTGTDVQEYSFVSPEDGKVMVNWDGELIEAAVFNDLLAPLSDTASVIGTYANNYYKGTPALIKNKYGRGECYYFGGAFSKEAVRVFIERLGVKAPYQEWLEIPDACELAVRKKEGKKYLFVMNYLGKDVAAMVKQEMKELLSGETCKGEVVLAPYETKVFVI